MKTRFLTCSLLLYLASCSKATDSQPELIKGDVVHDTLFKGTIQIRKSCTAAKVGPKLFLTAAHCGWLNGPNSTFSAGKIAVRKTRLASPPVAEWTALTIKEQFFAEGWKDATWPDPSFGEFYSKQDDVLLFTVNELTPHIEVAAVETDFVGDALPVAVMGYGCEASIYGESFDYEKSARLKAIATLSLPPNAFDHQGSSFNEKASDVYAHYIITPGAFYHKDDATDPLVDARASLCPGDSGGPVYTLGNKIQKIVGVNAYYTFLPRSDDPDRISVTNMHTRLSGKTGAWVRSILASYGH